MNTILLVVTSMSLITGNVHVESHKMKSIEECTAKGKQIAQAVRATRVSTVCWRLNK